MLTGPLNSQPNQTFDVRVSVDVILLCLHNFWTNSLKKYFLQSFSPADSIFILKFEQLLFITKTYLCNFDPFKPHFYIVKLGFTGVYIIFVISAQKHRLWVLVRTATIVGTHCGYLLEPPRLWVLVRTASLRQF